MPNAAKFRDLLEKTSRSFFLGIEQLQSPLKEDLTLAYLICRVFDTFEDSLDVAPEPRLAALRQCQKLLELLPQAANSADAELSQWRPPLPANPDETELLQNAPDIWRAIFDLTLAKRQSFARNLLPMVEGMYAEVEKRQLQQDLSPRDLQEFEDYCFYVAGTVGGLITDLFQIESVFNADANLSREDALSFGRSLQIVNIIKDFHKDWQEGRCFWPHVNLPAQKSAPPPALDELKASLDVLKKRFKHHSAKIPHYLEKISTHRRDAYFFCAFPFRMAEASLLVAEKDDAAWLQSGGTFKVSREETFKIFQDLVANEN